MEMHVLRGAQRGRDLKCAVCGAVREQDVRFIYDEMLGDNR